MAKILDMPKLSPTMEEGVLATWHKKEGDSVEVDDLLAEVETDKATMEFRAFDKGTLLKLLVEAGAEVKLGQPVAILGNEGEDISSLVAEAGGGAAEKTPAAKKKDAKRDEPEAEEEEPEEEDEPEGDEDEDADDEEPAETPRSPRAGAPKKKAAAAPKKKAARAAAPQTMRPSAPVDKGNVLTRTERDVATPARGGANGERVLASPYVRKVARERGIDLAGAQGSGEHGRIVPADLDSLGQPAPRDKALARAPQPGKLELAPPEVRPLSPMRKTIARRLTQSKQTVPHFYLTIDVDAEELAALREQINADLAAGAKPKAPNGEGPKPDKISLNDLLIKACAAALRRVPETNASFTDEAILVHDRVDVSVAVAIPDGLVTPVVRDADRKSVVAIAREVRDLASRARSKKLKPEEMSDGTFSISNLGMFGIDEFAAVINPPEGAILAVGQVRDEPVVKDGAVKPGKKLALTLSCDHRVVDGAVGAAFLAELRDLLERPMRILTG
ncbi:MAG: pyruvate dehydrogenase complex dihydrolipoamide acetyltransferase [Labilithrix sp.]|nr:pyruvate dehydrogenase complex dihydrolipoamide acetyltransferase [Labilithrix sp.]MBX3216588.1 pyruvate dehydrogenase complex dihydrolipoamide acetyltransferase [Labilithrix sp.]